MKIYVAGHRGLVGSAIVRILQSRGYDHLVLSSSKEMDLRHQASVENFFRAQTPDVVILAAAKVGGIIANMTYPAEFMYDNLAIQANVIHAAYTFGVRKLLFLGSSCIYPREAPQPMKEEYLLSGKLEPTNEGYAIAKIAGLKLCEMYNRQYGTDYISVIPCNIYGAADHFDPLKSHVVPALIRKFHEAKIRNDDSVEVWGTGKARRELLFSDDLAEACLLLMDHYSGSEFFNIGTGIDVSISELAETIKEVVGFRGSIRYDPSKPDGMPQKLLDVSKIQKVGWRSKTPLKEGLYKTYTWYLDRAEISQGGKGSE